MFGQSKQLSHVTANENVSTEAQIAYIYCDTNVNLFSSYRPKR